MGHWKCPSTKPRIGKTHQSRDENTKTGKKKLFSRTTLLSKLWTKRVFSSADTRIKTSFYETPVKCQRTPLLIEHSTSTSIIKFIIDGVDNLEVVSSDHDKITKSLYRSFIYKCRKKSLSINHFEIRKKKPVIYVDRHDISSTVRLFDEI